MGVQVPRGSVESGFADKSDPEKFFPGFDPRNAESFLYPVPADQCAQSVEVIYDVNYNALASDDADAPDVVDAIGAFAPIVSGGGVSVDTIINTIRVVTDTIDDVLDDTGVSVPFQSTFLAAPCDGENGQVFLLTLVAIGTAATSNPKKASGRFDATLEVGGVAVSDGAELTWKTSTGTTRATASWSVTVENAHYSSDPFTVTPAVTVSAWSDDDLFGTNACAVNVALIKVTITAIPERAWLHLPKDFKARLKRIGVNVPEPEKDETKDGKPKEKQGKKETGGQ